MRSREFYPDHDHVSLSRSWLRIVLRKYWEGIIIIHKKGLIDFTGYEGQSKVAEKIINSDLMTPPRHSDNTVSPKPSGMAVTNFLLFFFLPLKKNKGSNNNDTRLQPLTCTLSKLR